MTARAGLGARPALCRGGMLVAWFFFLTDPDGYGLDMLKCCGCYR
jgi:hypothetical protein